MDENKYIILEKLLCKILKCSTKEIGIIINLIEKNIIDIDNLNLEEYTITKKHKQWSMAEAAQRAQLMRSTPFFRKIL